MLHHQDELVHTLGLSVRKGRALVGFSSLYEFEDFIQEMDSSTLIQAEDFRSIRKSKIAYKVFREATQSISLSKRLSLSFIPTKSRYCLGKSYELFLPSFNSPYELFALRSVQGWRDRSRYAACYINEIWVTELKKCSYLLELLKDFDHIFIGIRHSVEQVEQLTGRPCTYLPIGIDALKFCPSKRRASLRTIDVCNIGRRSDITHQALLKMASAEDLFYYYDTVSSQQGVVNASKQNTFYVKDHKEHRLLLANILKHSRYFIANRALVNDSERTGGYGEIPSRYFEGAAAGTIMIGESPKSDIFNSYFGWEDAVLWAPFDAPHIADLIADLEAQPKRLDAIRRNNVINALLQHDWLHRLKVIYNTFDLPPSAMMKERSAAIMAKVEEISQLTSLDDKGVSTTPVKVSQ